ncbi:MULTISPECIES: DUF2834 domain-containing protein [Leptolyngbya]|uniref:DUF2834 domain-containing protein n=1 Tax=Leptolyngbya TaxID=47251 RepID=UPI0016833F3F|nr:DUF2834 domain-containing protein [Leptolyngbya sp. FACHB-1624]MBD1856970.1 DUF2834 domain-containing protein [Leptolyngbya sp. FACHB-1624]
MLTSTDASTTKTSTKPLYLLLAITGSILPWYWLLQDPTALLSPALFFQRAFANHIAITVASDLSISAITFFCFAWIELKRLKIARSWILVYVGLTFGIGLSCALPLFLYHREQILEQKAIKA